MSNKQNIAAKLIQEWQSNMQEYLKDPRVSEVMVEYYAKSKKTFDEMTGKQYESNAADTTDANDADDKLLKLTERLNELEARIKILERSISAGLDKAS